MPIFETLKVCILGSILIIAIAATWSIQNWRWEAKETNYVKAQLAELQKEASKADKAATQFEKKKEATDDVFKKIDKALGSNSSPSVVCFDPKRLRDVNSALARKTPDPGEPSNTLPGPDAAKR